MSFSSLAAAQPMVGVQPGLEVGMGAMRPNRPASDSLLTGEAVEQPNRLEPHPSRSARGFRVFSLYAPPFSFTASPTRLED